VRAWAPGAESVATLNVTPSSQKNPASTAAPAPLNVLWPDQYSGVPPMPPARGVQDGSASVSGLPSVSASRMAVPGRQCRHLPGKRLRAGHQYIQLPLDLSGRLHSAVRG